MKTRRSYGSASVRQESAVHLSGMETEWVGDTATMNRYSPKVKISLTDRGYSEVGIGRFGWGRSASFATDTLTFVRAEDLETAGKAVALGLMILRR